MRAGLIQGTISGLLTLIIKRAIELMFVKLKAPLRRVMPWMATATFVATTLITFHTIGGTPNLLATIAVPFSVSTTYAIVYTLTLPAP